MQVPLVDLATPTTRRVATAVGPDGEGREECVQHGLGCTAFWPGSHRHPEAVHLGAAAARHSGAGPRGGEQGATSAQKLGQLQPFIAACPLQSSAR